MVNQTILQFAAAYAESLVLGVLLGLLVIGFRIAL